MTGKELHDLRERKGISKAEAARMVGVSYQAEVGWEGTNNIQAPKAYELAEILQGITERTRPIITHAPRGEEIRILRKAYGYTAECLAGMVGVSAAQIGRYERGLEIPPDIEDSLCEIFGIKYERKQGSIRTGSGATWRQ